MKRHTPSWYDTEVRAIDDLAAGFFEREVLAHREKWEKQQCIDRSVWLKAGNLGLLCCSIPEQYGGGGGTFAHDLAVFRAQGYSGDMSLGISVHSGIVPHYIAEYGTEEHKATYLPGLASGEIVGAIGMTEPGTGSDLSAVKTTAIKHGDDYIVNGSKTFITNGSSADLVVLVVKTDPAAGAKGISLLLVDVRTSAGFQVGRVLDKIGQHGADTSELSFSDVRVPQGNLLGEVEGRGFAQLMTQLVQERLIIGAQAAGAMERAVQETVAYTKSRQAFGHSLFDFQNTAFELAECKTIARTSEVFLDHCVEAHLRGELDPADAAMVKYWLTQQQCAVIDRCLQLYGGYGYMREYLIARMYEDARVQKIYAGANEVMKSIIARTL